MAVDLRQLPQAFISQSSATVMSALTVGGVVLMLIGEYVKPAERIGWSKKGGY